MDLLDRVRATIRRHDLIGHGMRVMLTLSGGPDSVALALLLRELEGFGELTLAGVAHLHHGLRADADGDAEFCAHLARTLNVPFELAREDIRARARRTGRSLEAAGHDARYEFFAAAAVRLGADRVALGHSLDDQAETVLLRLLRGAGSRGLAGIFPRQGLFVRPLLETPRADLRSYLEDRGQTFRVDASNADLTIPRNRVRAELLPWLAQSFNPQVAQRLSDQADVARADWQFIEDTAHALLARCVHPAAEPGAARPRDEWVIDVAPVREAPIAVARAALRLLMERASAGRPVAFAHVLQALELFETEPRATGVDAPRQRLERVGPVVVLRSRTQRGRASAARGTLAPFNVPLPVPGEAQIPEAGCTVSADLVQDVASMPEGASVGRNQALVAREQCAEPLTIRNRRPGDRIQMAGMQGRKRLQDLLVDRKVPRSARDLVPIVVDQRDRIVWVAGHAVGGEFRVTDPAQAVIILRLKCWGGPA
jgi:tRNA(Ile)-lysidine synthase